MLECLIDHDARQPAFERSAAAVLKRPGCIVDANKCLLEYVLDIIVIGNVTGAYGSKVACICIVNRTQSRAVALMQAQSHLLFVVRCRAAAGHIRGKVEVKSRF